MRRGPQFGLTIERILSKLPRLMMADWIRKTDDIYTSNREPVFRDLCDFVANKARLAQNRYSHSFYSSNKGVKRGADMRQKTTMMLQSGSG